MPVFHNCPHCGKGRRIDRLPRHNPTGLCRQCFYKAESDKRVRHIARVILQEPGLTRLQLAERVGINERTITEYLARLSADPPTLTIETSWHGQPALIHKGGYRLRPTSPPRRRIALAASKYHV